MSVVNYFQNTEDMQAALLGSLGFSTFYIQQRTGLTKCQVLYRLGKARVKRMEYRNGESAVATLVLGKVHSAVKKEIRDRLNKSLRPGHDQVKANGATFRKKSFR